MSKDIHGQVMRDNVQVYKDILFQIDRMSSVETLAHASYPPYFLYNGYCMGQFDLRQNDYIVDLYNKDPVTNQAKAYQIINEIESFPDMHVEFDCARADRAALTRTS